MKGAPSGAGLLGRESFYWLVGGFSELTIVCRRGFWAEPEYSLEGLMLKLFLDEL